MNTWAILLAAGSGSRLAGHGRGLPKQFLLLDGEPLFWHSALTFSRLPSLRGIVFVFPPSGGDDSPEQNGETLLQRLNAGNRLGLAVRTAVGGERRQDSVANGLAALPPDCDAVLVHDSARPFASAALMTRVLAGLEAGQVAVIPGIAVPDTIKTVDDKGRVACTHARGSLRAVQTPQGFLLGPLREAHALARQHGWEVTDDAALMERSAMPVLVVEGEERNHKITTPGDLALLEGQGRSGGGNGAMEMLPCSGFGYDVHRYGGDRPFILGGVPIRCDITVAAHSDGDTLLHALMDAMLGCIGGGDIGALFPDTDQAFDNISSGVLLAEVLERTRMAGLRITGVDITIVAQAPRIAPHREAITANLAKMLQLPLAWINVKATTEERLGFTGEKKGIKVMALVSGLRPVVSTNDGGGL
ncbi:MAG: 2-C-methyl-D-erythritol 4-phosphate cytidylyltransferase [Desulfovibrionaceae bacterium]|nr:2-C-methyl-D-erythritol 4-phosphate cytidylyltransferase [Desulfovibrionaceae bacterium]